MPTISANIIQDAFGPLIKVFETILVFIHAHITGGSWGLAIIGLTIVVRAALVPLTLKQFSSMAKLQALGPELKELQKKYKDDKPRLNEEMMKFYKQNEVNPFGSCLPLVLQLPVFLSLFYMLRLDLKPHICGAALKAHHIVSQTAIGNTSCGAIDPNSGKFLFIPDVTSAAHGGVLVDPRRPLRRIAARREPADDRDGRPQSAAADARAAVRLRSLHSRLPGRSAGLLDHDEHLDGRPAVHRQAALCADAGPGGRGEGGRGGERRRRTRRRCGGKARPLCHPTSLRPRD